MQICVNCGTSRSDGQKFCSSCGSEFPTSGSWGQSSSESSASFTTSKFCTGGGEGLIATAAVCPRCGTSAGGGSGPVAKDKTIAILLAVFLGPWTWLYTFEKDQQKFWIGLGTSIAGLVLTVVFIGFFALLGVWIWSIVDVAQRPASWYVNYPNE